MEDDLGGFNLWVFLSSWEVFYIKNKWCHYVLIYYFCRSFENLSLSLSLSLPIIEFILGEERAFS
jgi:hypothetical protein